MDEQDKPKGGSWFAAKLDLDRGNLCDGTLNLTRNWMRRDGYRGDALVGAIDGLLR